jgi:hypothetical protein
VKIYAVTVEELKKKERQDETQFTTKTEVPPPLNNASVFVFVFLNFTLFMIKLRVLNVVFLTL